MAYIVPYTSESNDYKHFYENPNITACTKNRLDVIVFSDSSGIVLQILAFSDLLT